MFETRSLASRIVLQVVLTIAVLPFLIPIVTMLAKSFEGGGWANYAAVIGVPGFFRFFLNSAIVANGRLRTSLIVTHFTNRAFVVLSSLIVCGSSAFDSRPPATFVHVSPVSLTRTS